MSSEASRLETIEDATPSQFSSLLRDIDWAHETATAFWAKSGAPGLAVINIEEDSRLWFAGHNWMKSIAPGGGHTFRDSFEFVVGFSCDTSIAIPSNHTTDDIAIVEHAFVYFLEGDITSLSRLLVTLPMTDTYK